MERCIKQRLLPFVLDNGIIPANQYGFRPSHSVSDQLITCTDDWTEALDKKLCVDVIYFDMKKAFDKVPHQRLLQKLRLYGITGRANSVCVDGSQSQVFFAQSGIGQGTCLGPVLFSIFIADIMDGYEGPAKSVLFADDIKLYFAYKPSDFDPSILQAGIDHVQRWSATNCLPMSLEKCTVLHLGQGSPQHGYTIDGHPITTVASMRDLGVTMTRDLTPTTHVHAIASRAKQRLHLLFKLISSTDYRILRRCYSVYVRSILESSSSVYSPYLKKDVRELESVQRRATKIILNRCFPTSEPLSYS
ncbi:RNA-directed DNA polymerase from mobile element jockey-like protein [Aphelenchoides avenae]|nr:RNA-directed DNA polymerase from mobile element jockey-like protein [Aphelenchus avenae]